MFDNFHRKMEKDMKKASEITNVHHGSLNMK
jgi:hypothetical protein